MTRRIDAGGFVQFFTGYKEQSPVLQLEYILKESVDPEKLQTALERAINVFGVFRVKVVLDKYRKPVYEENGTLPVVYKDDGKPHAYGNESLGYLFRIYYLGNRIGLSIHHTLTDFHGANEFMKYILRCYLNLTDENISVSTDTISVDPADMRDPYDLYGDIRSVGYNMADKWENELVVPNRMQYRRDIPQEVCSLVLPVEKILQAAKKNDSSVFPLLTWLMANALADTYDSEDKIVVGGGAADYRAIYNSRTPLNFSHSFNTVFLPRERGMSLETQFTVQRFRMDLKLERETVDREVALRREAAANIDGPIEQYINDQETLDERRKKGEEKSSFFLSYMGKMDLPDDLAEYVDFCWISSPTTRGPIKVLAYSWRETMYMNIIEMACEKSIIPGILDIFEKYDAKSYIMGRRLTSYDYYPLEELVPISDR